MYCSHSSLINDRYSEQKRATDVVLCPAQRFNNKTVLAFKRYHCKKKKNLTYNIHNIFWWTRWPLHKKKSEQKKNHVVNNKLFNLQKTYKVPSKIYVNILTLLWQILYQTQTSIHDETKSFKVQCNSTNQFFLVENRDSIYNDTENHRCNK